MKYVMHRNVFAPFVLSLMQSSACIELPHALPHRKEQVVACEPNHRGPRRKGGLASGRRLWRRTRAGPRSPGGAGAASGPPGASGDRSVDAKKWATAVERQRRQYGISSTTAKRLRHRPNSKLGGRPGPLFYTPLGLARQSQMFALQNQHRFIQQLQLGKDAGWHAFWCRCLPQNEIFARFFFFLLAKCSETAILDEIYQRVVLSGFLGGHHHPSPFARPTKLDPAALQPLKYSTEAEKGSKLQAGFGTLWLKTMRCKRDEKRH